MRLTRWVVVGVVCAMGTTYLGAQAPKAPAKQAPAKAAAPSKPLEIYIVDT